MALALMDKPCYHMSTYSVQSEKTLAGLKVLLENDENKWCVRDSDGEDYLVTLVKAKNIVVKIFEGDSASDYKIEFKTQKVPSNSFEAWNDDVKLYFDFMKAQGGFSTAN